MKRILLYLFFLLLFVSSITFSQEQAIDTSQPVPTSTPVEDDDVLEIEGFDKIPEPKIVTGKVIGVYDGDTVTVLDDAKQQHKVRFNGIDAPEAKQDFGSKSQKNLSDLVFGKIVTINCPKVDKYGRNVCTVFLDKLDINLEQIKGGFAWHYKKYESEQTPEDRQAYSEAEINARNLKLGLWSQPNPTEPSAWRRGENNPNVAGVPKTAIIGNTNSMVYHTPGCSSWARVSQKNRVLFETEQEAIKKGYRISGQCESNLPIEERPKPTPNDTKRVYQTGSRGGCYYLSPSGKKNYVDKKFCQNSSSSNTSNNSNNSSNSNTTNNSSNGSTTPTDSKYIKGSKGGCYYINSKGKKTYVDREKCN